MKNIFLFISMISFISCTRDAQDDPITVPEPVAKLNYKMDGVSFSFEGQSFDPSVKYGINIVRIITGSTASKGFKLSAVNSEGTIYFYINLTSDANLALGQNTFTSLMGEDYCKIRNSILNPFFNNLRGPSAYSKITVQKIENGYASGIFEAAVSGTGTGTPKVAVGEFKDVKIWN